jgi:hypothetical protein
MTPRPGNIEWITVISMALGWGFWFRYSLYGGLCLSFVAVLGGDIRAIFDMDIRANAPFLLPLP